MHFSIKPFENLSFKPHLQVRYSQVLWLFYGKFCLPFLPSFCTSISCFMYPLTYFVYYDAKSLVFLSVIFPQHFSLPLYSLFHSTWTSLFLLRFSTTFGCLINETANYKLQNTVNTKHCKIHEINWCNSSSAAATPTNPRQGRSGRRIRVRNGTRPYRRGPHSTADAARRLFRVLGRAYGQLYHHDLYVNEFFQ